MKTALISSLTLATALAVGVSTSAQAAQLADGTSLGFSSNGTGVNATTYTGSSISAPGTITIGRGFVSASAGDFAEPVVPFDLVFNRVLFNTNQITTSSLISFSVGSLTAPPNRFTFTATAVDSTSSATSLTLDYIGTVTDSTGFYDPTPGDFSLSFTQTAANAPITYSGNLVSPPTGAVVPEPLTTAGAALALGLGFLAKRKTRSLKK